MIDAHHHIWRQADLPWLNGPMQPRIFGPYEAIMRDYLIDEFLADVAGTGVTRSVYVQANWAPDRFEDEVAWVQSVANQAGWPHAIVGYANFLADDVRTQLDRLAKYPLMRGVRMQLHWHQNELYRFASEPELARNEMLRRNVNLLAEYGWSFDLQVFANQMEGAAGLAASCPRVTFVLQHAGMLEDLSEAGRAAWRAGMQLLADRPNVVCKLSGLGTFLHRNAPEHIADMVHQAVTMFGSDRCLFGSNYPIEKLWTRYSDLVAAFKTAASGLSKADQSYIFNDTAARVYRMAP